MEFWNVFESTHWKSPHCILLRSLCKLNVHISALKLINHHVAREGTNIWIRKMQEKCGLTCGRGEGVWVVTTHFTIYTLRRTSVHLWRNNFPSVRFPLVFHQMMMEIVLWILFQLMSNFSRVGKNTCNSGSISKCKRMHHVCTALGLLHRSGCRSFPLLSTHMTDPVPDNGSLGRIRFTKRCSSECPERWWRPLFCMHNRILSGFTTSIDCYLKP